MDDERYPDDQHHVDTFAAFALNGILAGGEAEGLSAKDVAEASYEYAVAMADVRRHFAVKEGVT